jgi:argininosuccinate synthase
MKPQERVVLAYSGGVDTTACIPYLRHEMGCKYIVAMIADLGQGEELGPLCEKATKAGADVAVAVDVKERFIIDFAWPAIRANAMYDGHYPLMSALGRPLIGQQLVQTAYQHDCGAVAHGCTGKGNDQVRIDLAVALGNPALKILAPAREWSFSRAETIAYSEKFGISPHVTKERPWAIDLNVLGRNVEAGLIEDLKWEPTEEVWAMTTAIEHAPAQAEYVRITFERGIPVGLDGVTLRPFELMNELNRRAGRHGIGRIDMIENRVVGLKSRELYEAPGMLTLITAHRDLESFTLPADLLREKRVLEQKYAQLVYDGMWFTALKQCLDSFFEATQAHVSGTVEMKLFKGKETVVKRESAESLYRLDLVTYGKACTFNQRSAEGFIDILGLPQRVWRSAHPA